MIVTVQPSAKLQQMMHRNGKKSRFAPHNSGFSQKEAKTPRGIHHGGTVTDDPQKYKIPVEE